MQGSTCVRAATTTPAPCSPLSVCVCQVRGLSRQGGWVAWRSILGRLPGRGVLPRSLQEGEAPPILSVSQVQPLSAVPRVVKFTSGLSAVVAEEGCEATFQCVVTPSDVAVTWFRDGVQLQPGEKFLISQKGASHSLTILSLALEDAGQVTAEAEGIQSTAALRVRGELVGRQGGRHSFLYQVLLVSCTDTPCCRPGSSPLG